MWVILFHQYHCSYASQICFLSILIHQMVINCSFFFFTSQFWNRYPHIAYSRREHLTVFSQTGKYYITKVLALFLHFILVRVVFWHFLFKKKKKNYSNSDCLPLQQQKALCNIQIYLSIHIKQPFCTNILTLPLSTSTSDFCLFVCYQYHCICSPVLMTRLSNYGNCFKSLTFTSEQLKRW